MKLDINNMKIYRKKKKTEKKLNITLLNNVWVSEKTKIKLEKISGCEIK